MQSQIFYLCPQLQLFLVQDLVFMMGEQHIPRWLRSELCGGQIQCSLNHSHDLSLIKPGAMDYAVLTGKEKKSVNGKTKSFSIHVVS